MMLHRLAAGLCAGLFFAGFAGCGNPKDNANDSVNAADRSADRAAENTQQAANNAGNAVENATDNAGAAIKDAAKDATGAMVVTPMVKSAITADKTLNDDRNTINVDTKDNVVHLRGTVLNNAMKKRAGEIAQKVLTENNSTDRLSNELKVTQH